MVGLPKRRGGGSFNPASASTRRARSQPRCSVVQTRAFEARRGRPDPRTASAEQNFAAQYETARRDAHADALLAAFVFTPRGYRAYTAPGYRRGVAWLPPLEQTGRLSPRRPQPTPRASVPALAIALAAIGAGASAEGMPGMPGMPSAEPATPV